MSIQYEVLRGGFIAIVLLTIGGLLAAPRLTALMRRGWGRPLRIVFGAVLVAVIVAALGLRAIGAPIDPSSQPLTAEGSFGVDDPRLLAMHEVSPAQGQADRQEFDYAYAPGAVLTASFALTNTGSVPLTVTGFASDPGAGVRSVELRLPPSLSPNLPVANKGDGSPWASEPFHSFEIQPGASVGLVVAVTLGECRGMTPVPTLAPGVTYPPDAAQPLTGGYGVLGDVDIDYTAFGIARTAHLSPPFYMQAIWAQGNVFGCAPGVSFAPRGVA